MTPTERDHDQKILASIGSGALGAAAGTALISGWSTAILIIVPACVFLWVVLQLVRSIGASINDQARNK